MQIYRSNFKKTPGSSYKEIYPYTLRVYKNVRSRSKRQPYVRSRYFSKNKVFLDLFWQHIHEKNHRDRVRRLQYFEAGLDVVRNSNYKPNQKKNPNNTSEQLYRFTGSTKDNQIFYVQIKENTRTNRKGLISIFPAN